MLGMSTAEELRAIRESCEARRRYAKIQMIALTAMAAVVTLLALFVLPKAAAALAEMEAAAGALASVDVVGMAERVDALVQKGSDSMDEAMRGLETGLADLDRALQVLEGIDLESLNESIAFRDPGAAFPPLWALKRLFGQRDAPAFRLHQAGFAHAAQLAHHGAAVRADVFGKAA